MSKNEDHPQCCRALLRCNVLGEAPYSDSAIHLFRPYLGSGHAATLRQIGEWMTEAGMSTRIDAAGNIIGRYEGTRPEAPALLIGSHVDSVRDAGRYDGMLGVVLGIETVARFATLGRRFPFAIEVVGFGDEEGSRFPVSMLTTRAVAGTLDGQDMDLSDQHGVSLGDALEKFDLDVTRFAAAARRSEDVLAYIEAHIEQGPVLQAEGRALGVVSAIAAQYRFRIVVTGTAGHAGTMTMRLRRDALAAAAEMVLTIERIGSAGPDDLVATVGHIEVSPGVANVVPGRAVFSIDIRAGNNERRNDAADAMRLALKNIAQQRGVTLEIALQQDLPATPCNTDLTRLMEQAVQDVTGAKPHVLVSGAGHDAMVMAQLAPISMLFIRCRDGISHNPAEAVTSEDVQTALEAMMAFVDRFERANARAGQTMKPTGIRE